jgi:putative RecB family exonuclease
MVLPVPTSLSPSKLTAFTDCALAFRYSAIDRLPEPPSPWTVKGSLVHAALEQLFCLDGPDRTPDAADACFEQATALFRADAELAQLELEPDAEAELFDGARELVQRYFTLEDPRTVHAIGLELYLSAEVGGHVLRGIIDRLDWEDGELVVTDYKTGRAPDVAHERARMKGVHFYSLLCESLFGQRPKRIQLLHLAEPVAIMVEPDDRSVRGLKRTVGAVWNAIERACERDDFRPNPSRLCDYCAYKPYCPAHGGDPDAARELVIARDVAVA